MSILDFFRLMFCSTILDSFVNETNSYAENNANGAKRSWSNLSVDDFFQ